MEETVLFSHGPGVFADAVNRIYNGYENKHSEKTKNAISKREE